MSNFSDTIVFFWIGENTEIPQALVDSIRLEPCIKENCKIKKGQLIGAFALGGSALLMLTNKTIVFENKLECLLTNQKLPVKIEVCQNISNE